jgi:hypothetical protein
MLRSIGSFLAVLIIAGNISAADADVERISGPGSFASSVGADAERIAITGIDRTGFPNITVSIFINKSCAMAGRLSKDDFEVFEDGRNAAVDQLAFTGNASGMMLDLAIVFDDTGSMGRQIEAMKYKINDMTRSIKAAGIDASYCLVSFKDSVLVKRRWSNDSEGFKRAIDTMYASFGGSDEPQASLDAVEAVLSTGFRRDAQKIVLLVTDAHSHHRDDALKVSNYSMAEVAGDLAELGAMLVVVSPDFEDGGSFVDPRDLANESQGVWIDINKADFSAIVEQIRRLIIGSYVIEYRSPAPNESLASDAGNSSVRAVQVKVDAIGCVNATAFGFYHGPVMEVKEANQTAPGSVAVDVAFHEAARNVLWNKTFGGPGNETASNALKTDDGGYALVGWTDSFGDGRLDVLLIKTDSHGSEEWNRTFGWSGDDWAWSALQADDGGYVIAGETDSYGSGRQDVWIIKTDRMGMKQWDRTFGGTLDDGANSISKTQDGGYIIAGWTESYGKGGRDLWIVKIDSNGSREWSNVFGGPADESAKDIMQTTDGGYIVAGDAQPVGEGGKDFWLVKLDSRGEMEWNRTFGGFMEESARAVRQTLDGGYIIAGQTDETDSGEPDALVVKTDGNGRAMWEKTFGGDDREWISSILLAEGGGYILGGVTGSSGSGGLDFWLVRIEENGSPIWQRTHGGRGRDSASTILPTDDGGYIIAGGTQSFGAGWEDVWLLKTGENASAS